MKAVFLGLVVFSVLTIPAHHSHLLPEDAVGNIGGYVQPLQHTHPLSGEVLSVISEWLSL